MNTSQFMDKQILGLAASTSPSSSVAAGGGRGVELLDLMSPNPQEEAEDRRRRRHSSNGSAEDVLPSYDFQPIRTTAGSTAAPASWGVPRLQGRLRLLQPQDIDRTMKKYSDNLLHALEGVSSRLSQLEGRTHHLENSGDELKLTISNCNGSTDGKLGQLENMLREVQAGVQILRFKQEIVETQLHLAKLQTPKTETQLSESSGAGQADSRQQPVAPPQAAIQQSAATSSPDPFPITSTSCSKCAASTSNASNPTSITVSRPFTSLTGTTCCTGSLSASFTTGSLLHFVCSAN